MQNDYALITGASSGIGRSLAQQLAGKGMNIIAVARRMDRLQELKKELEKQEGVRVEILVFDLSQTDRLDEFYERTRDFSIKYWINNAGFTISKDLLELNTKDIDAIMRVNDLAVAILSNRYAADYKEVKGAQLVNVSSIAGYALTESSPFYAASKFFVSAYTEALAHYLKSNGHSLRAKVLAPAATESEFASVGQGVDDPVDYDQIYNRYHSANQMAAFLIELLESEAVLGKINTDTFEFELLEQQLPDLYDN